MMFQSERSLAGLRALASPERKSEDQYDYYDYNYYAGFEVLRQPDQTQSDRSTQHKIETQFSGTTSARRERPSQGGSI